MMHVTAVISCYRTTGTAASGKGNFVTTPTVLYECQVIKCKE